MKLMYKISLVALLSLSGCATKEGNLSQPQAATNINITDNTMESKMVAYVNSLRAKGATCGPAAPRLNLNSALKHAASSHAKDMALNSIFSHSGSGTATDPAKSALGVGSSHIERFLYFGFPNKPGKLVGEVLGKSKFTVTHTKDFMANAKHAINNLMKDQPHCEIIMNPRFTDIGIGVYKNDGAYYVDIDLGETN